MTSLFVSLTIFGFIAAGLLYYKYEQLRKSFHNFKLQTTAKDESLYSGMAFYYKNPVLGIEVLTPALQRLLDINKQLTLEQLRDYLRKENPGVLGSLLSELYEGKGSTFGILKIPVSNKKVICHASRINNEEGQFGALLLLFVEPFAALASTGKKSANIQSMQKAMLSLLTVLNYSPYPIWQRDKSLEIVYANFAYLNILGDRLKTINDGQGMEIYQEGKDLAKAAIAASEAKTQRMHLVVEGERKLFKITEVPTDEKTTIGFARDISEIEELEEELQQNIEAQSHFLESSTNATAIFGPDKKLRFFNSAYSKLWSLDEKWLEERPSYGEILERLRERRKLPEQVDFKAFKEKQVNLFTQLIDPSEEFFYLPDGVVLRVITVPHESGGLIFAYEDITDKLALEQSYNTLIAVKKATIDNLHEGIAVFREDGRLNLYNPNFAEMWQLENSFLDNSPHISEILEETKYLYNYGDKWEKYKQDLIKLFSRRESGTVRLIRKDGSVLDWSNVPLPDGNTLMTYSDITDSFLVEKSLRSEKEALKEADTLKSNFLANVSYELRSPLTSIRGFSEALLQNYFGELNPKQKEYMDGIYQSSLNLTSMINDVLDMASIDAGYMHLDLEEFDLYAAINEVSSKLNDRIKSLGRNLIIECPKDIGSIYADRRRIIQVLTNLINNAVRQTEDGGIVKVKAEFVKNKFKISVEDNGRGMDIAEQQDIFKQFYKKYSDTSAVDSTSLSLPIVKSFIELHGGEIKVASEKGKGTVITCILNKYSAQ